jgi:hypothetical protein
MEKDDLTSLIEDIVDRKIRQHEVRVGWISGILGVSFVLGIMHSIGLMRNSLS